MKRILFLVVVTLFAASAFSQKDADAKALLDRTYSAFRNASGISANYSMTAVKGGKNMAAARGSIKLKGTKFVLKSPGSTIWFNGKTQWNFIYKNEEVNVTNPTATELQNINPYFILSLYQKGFNYKMGASKRGGKEVILTAQNSRSTISKINIIITSKNTPKAITITRRDGSHTSLNISGYKTGGRFNDSMFTFNKNKYPKVEVVDLR
jgi:outer membrane lipoprotein-sorting protein